ncbi:MAG: hypothetical protein JW829_17715 [Pirellulales bacterium]|nr:hypothetical protein [Pirellulales bacterium]
MATNRPRGYRNWNPQAESQELMRKVWEVLEEYRTQWPLTLRQVFYRLVGTCDYPKTETAYDSLCEKLNLARREPRNRPWKVPWNALRDDGIIERLHNGYTDAEQFIATVRYSAERFSLDLMRFQPFHVEVHCEAGGMVPQLQTVAQRYGADVCSCGGFNSTTHKHDLAVRLSSIGKPVKLLHIGDYDPSGVHIANNLDEDVQAFLGHYGGDVELIRLAVTPEQQAEYDLPTAPPKTTDRRSFDSDWTVQAEALRPDDLAQIVATGIEANIDLEILAFAREQETEIRGDVMARLSFIRLGE